MKHIKKFFGELVRVVFSYIRRADKFLILVAAAASVYGLILINSATQNSGSSRPFIVQIGAIGIGFVLMIAVSAVNYEVLGYFWKVIAVFCVGLLILTLILGTGRAGADDTAWIRLGPISIQPSEFVKLGFIVCFATICGKFEDHISSPLAIFILCITAAVPIGFVVLQKDLGSAMIFVLIFIAMLFCAGVKLRYFAIAGVLTAIAAPIFWFKILNDFHRSRILVAFTPEVDPLNFGYQQYYGRLAIGSGQFTGLGLYNGIQTQSGFISEAQNDFIFAVAGEELGFLGAAAILILITVIIIRVLVIAFTADDMMSRLICVGVASMYLFQLTVNVGMCLCLMPVIGVTLPFFSAGGSSALTCWLGIGLVEGVRIQSRPVETLTGEKIRRVKLLQD